MDKQEFENLELTEQVAYLNGLCEAGKVLRS